MAAEANHLDQCGSHGGPTGQSPLLNAALNKKHPDDHPFGRDPAVQTSSRCSEIEPCHSSTSTSEDPSSFGPCTSSPLGPDANKSTCREEPKDPQQTGGRQGQPHEAQGALGEASPRLPWEVRWDPQEVAVSALNAALDEAFEGVPRGCLIVLLQVYLCQVIANVCARIHAAGIVEWVGDSHPTVLFTLVLITLFIVEVGFKGALPRREERSRPSDGTSTSAHGGCANAKRPEGHRDAGDRSLRPGSSISRPCCQEESACQQ